MKNLFLPYACAEKFRAAKREDAMKILEFLRKQTERGLEILKFLGARRFGLQRAAWFLKFEPKLCNEFEILFIRELSDTRLYGVATKGSAR